MVVRAPERRRADVAALAFKIMNDPFVGSLTFVAHLLGQDRERLLPAEHGQGPARAHRPHPADAREQPRGDQGGAAPATSWRSSGLKNTTTGDTLCDAAKPVDPGADGVPGSGHRGRGRAAVQGRPGEDGRRRCRGWRPRIRRSASAVDPESGQTVIKGMGELHLEIIVDRMKREFKVEANVGAPQVAYRETITRARRRRLHPQEADRRLGPVRARQAACSSRGEKGTGFKFENKVVGGTVPEGIHPGRRRRASNSADAERRHRGLPDGRSRGPAGRRRLPRGRQLGRWRSRSRPAPPSRRASPRPARSCSSR